MRRTLRGHWLVVEGGLALWSWYVDTRLPFVHVSIAQTRSAEGGLWNFIFSKPHPVDELEIGIAAKYAARIHGEFKRRTAPDTPESKVLGEVIEAVIAAARIKAGVDHPGIQISLDPPIV